MAEIINQSGTENNAGAESVQNLLQYTQASDRHPDVHRPGADTPPPANFLPDYPLLSPSWSHLTASISYQSRCNLGLIPQSLDLNLASTSASISASSAASRSLLYSIATRSLLHLTHGPVVVRRLARVRARAVVARVAPAPVIRAATRLAEEVVVAVAPFGID